jgi:flavorubredoxin
MEKPYAIGPDVFVLASTVTVPGLGMLPVNAFLVRGAQPYLVDTGLIGDAQELTEAVCSLVDPDDLRWILLTHDDPDHVGALLPLLDRARQARVVTTFLGLAKLQLQGRAVPPERLHLLNPGQRLELGDRTLAATRPPVFDSPETTAFHDGRLDALFCADCFGGPLPRLEPLANGLPGDLLAHSQVFWATVDSPWLLDIDRARFEAALAGVVALDAEWILSAHLPPAHRLARTMCENLSRVPASAPFVGPDQQAFQAMLEEAAAPA